MEIAKKALICIHRLSYFDPAMLLSVKYWRRKEYKESHYEYFFLDSERDTLMCHCRPETAAIAPGWCANHAASNLFNRMGQTMWVSEQDRIVMKNIIMANDSSIRWRDSEYVTS